MTMIITPTVPIILQQQQQQQQYLYGNFFRRSIQSKHHALPGAWSGANPSRPSGVQGTKTLLCTSGSRDIPVNKNVWGRHHSRAGCRLMRVGGQLHAVTAILSPKRISRFPQITLILYTYILSCALFDIFPCIKICLECALVCYIRLYDAIYFSFRSMRSNDTLVHTIIMIFAGINI